MKEQPKFSGAAIFCSSLFVSHYSSLISHYSFLITHNFSSLITHYSSLIIISSLLLLLEERYGRSHPKVLSSRRNPCLVLCNGGGDDCARVLSEI